MKKIDLGQTITIFANLGVIGGLVFVGLQLEQDLNIAEFDALASDQVLVLEFSRFTAENAETWRKGLAGDPLDEDEYVTFDVLANALFRMYANSQRQNIVLQAQTVGLDRNSAARAYAFFVYENPGLRMWFERLIANRIIIDDAFGLPERRFFPAVVVEFLEQLDEQNPKLPSRRFFPY